MKAPETILLHGYSFDDGPCKNWTTEPLKNGLRGHAIQYEKYIRKDALLEWLEALKAQALELREEGCGDVFYGAQIALLEETIHKIESL